MTNAEKAARLEKGIAEVRAKLNNRRAELREKELERRKKEFDRMPIELRKAWETVGWSPYQAGQMIRRECGRIEVKK